MSIHLAYSPRVNTKKRRSRRQVMDELSAYAFLLPALLFVAALMLYPMLHSFYLSFTSYDFVYDKAPTYAGLHTYMEVLKDGVFGVALRNTAYFALGFFPLLVVFSLGVALLLNMPLHGNTLVRTSVFLPVIVSLALTGVMFQGMILSGRYGLLNHILGNVLGLKSWTREWLTDPKTAMPALIAVSLWKYVGFEALIFLAGLQAIPMALYDAGKVDGANAWQRLLHVTLPNLRESFTLVGIWGIIQSVKVFEQPFIMTQGGPANSTLTLYYYTWINAFDFFEMGKASASAYVICFIILIFSLANMYFTRGERV